MEVYNNLDNLLQSSNREKNKTTIDFKSDYKVVVGFETLRSPSEQQQAAANLINPLKTS